MGSGGWQHGGAAASFVEGGRGRGAAVEAEKNKKKRVQLRGKATGEERGEGEAGGGGSNQPGHVLPTPRLRPSGNWITRWMDG